MSGRKEVAITANPTAARIRRLAELQNNPADTERLMFAAAAIEDREALRDWLRTLSVDMHQASTRPCPTCDPITKLLGEPFGCRSYEAQVRARRNGGSTDG